MNECTIERTNELPKKWMNEENKRTKERKNELLKVCSVRGIHSKQQGSIIIEQIRHIVSIVH